MIYFYSGTPGSGKSLHVAQIIYDAIRDCKNVIANFEINEKSIKPYNKRCGLGSFVSLENYEFSVSGLLGFSKNFHKCDKSGNMQEGQTIIVIDECQLLFNSRSWNVKGRDAWASFFTQHRKYGYDVILVSQFDRLVDRQIRSLIEYEYKHRKINNFKKFGKILGLLCGGNLFCYVNYWYGVREKIGVKFFRGNKRCYNLYNSYKLFDTVG